MSEEEGITKQIGRSGKVESLEKQEEKGFYMTEKNDKYGVRGVRSSTDEQTACLGDALDAIELEIKQGTSDDTPLILTHCLFEKIEQLGIGMHTLHSLQLCSCFHGVALRGDALRIDVPGADILRSKHDQKGEGERLREDGGTDVLDEHGKVGRQIVVGSTLRGRVGTEKLGERKSRAPTVVSGIRDIELTGSVRQQL